MYLDKLLAGISTETNVVKNIFVNGICHDSRQLKKGDLFIAYPGTESDGRHFIQDAIASGAVAVLLEAKGLVALPKLSVPCVAIYQLISQVGFIASRFYGDPSHKLSVVGITGTNGKTSCTHFLAQCLHFLNIPCGVIGTLGNGLYPNLKPSKLTTPDPIHLHRLMAEMLKQGAKVIALEVSSHRLAQHGLQGVKFAIAAFTNLSRDHLDYHGTFENYAQAKRSFFDLPDIEQAVLNADDEIGQQWLAELHDKMNLWSFSLSSIANEAFSEKIYAQQSSSTLSGLQAQLVTPWGEIGIANAFLLGVFNLSNLLLVFTLLKLLHVPLADCVRAIAQIQTINGRMQVFRKQNKPFVVVDFAHTPEALKLALKTLRSYCRGKLFCVFGCGGERDQGKRAIMGRVAESYADHIILTNDNSRFENPEQIIQAIQQGIQNKNKVTVELDRKLAISRVIFNATEKDMVLIAGKGHELYQLIAGKSYPFNDATVVNQLLNDG